MQEKKQNYRLILKNSWRYTGQIIEEDSENLIILDKFSNRVTLRKADIMIKEELA